MSMKEYEMLAYWNLNKFYYKIIYLFKINNN
jgi:hypothetical protein